MAVGPLYYSAYDAACVVVAAEFPDAGKGLAARNHTPLTPAEVEEMVSLLMTADSETVWALVTTHLRNGKSIKSLGDTIQIGAAELILRTTVPRQFTDGQHPFDYCNTANDWLRRTTSPYQARVLYLMANFVNDAARSNKLTTPMLEQECAGFQGEATLEKLDEAILAFDIPRATATANAYLSAGGDRRAYQAAVAVTACKFQDDPHNQKITHSNFEEYGHNSTHLHDRLLLAPVRLLAGWPKMPGERECYARFEKEWLDN
jgi:hypothetical protein